MKKSIKQLAQKIITLENNISQGINVKESEKEIERLAITLSLEDMMAIDQYIMQEKIIN